VSATTRARLAELLAADDMDLAEANLLIAAEASPGLDAAGALAEVATLADAARAEGVVPALRDRGFRGDDEDYDDPRNSFLDQVLRRRRGLPIALATLTLAVARRVGHPMAGVGMPGHFVVADLSGREPLHLDPFDGWRALSAADLARIVHDVTGLALRPEFLAPVTARAILARTLTNLRSSYLRRRRLEDALWTVELGLVVAPGDAELSRERMALLAGVGRYAEAEEAGEALLAAWPPDDARAAVEAQLAAVRDMRRRMN
jgi:regulator of sirC expression with transglutaminase-like and TPR domain